MGVQKYVYNCELYYYLLIIVLFICIVCLFHMNNCKPIFAYPCVLSYLHQNVYSSFIHYSQNLEVTQIAINKKVNKQIEVYSYNKKDCTIDTYQWRWASEMSCLVTEAKHKQDTLWDTIYMRF